MHILNTLVTEPEKVEEKCGYTSCPLTFTAKTANAIGIPVGILFSLLFCIPAWFIMRDEYNDIWSRLSKLIISFYEQINEHVTGIFSLKSKTIILMVFVVMGIIITTVFLLFGWFHAIFHELTHAFAWTMGTPLRIKDCTLKLIPQPSCHCPIKEVPISRSLVGTLAPAFITGVLPVILAVVFRSLIVLLLGGYGIAVAGMDIFHSLLRISFLRFKGSIYRDSDILIGGIVYIPRNSL